MTDYKELYLKMFRAAEQAANILIAAQRECEELYLTSPGPELPLTPLPVDNPKSGE